MRKILMLLLPGALLLTACAAAPSLPALSQQVADSERAFAKTMADRDQLAFANFVSDEAVFIGGKILHGKQQVADGWKPFFANPDAPFSWEPTEVEVLASGKLAHSSGPVRDHDGKVIATFNSVWRQEAPGVWRVIFDKGCEACDCAKP